MNLKIKGGQILSPIFLHNLVKINLPYPLPKATTFRAHSNGNPREPEREENPTQQQITP